MANAKEETDDVVVVLMRLKVQPECYVMDTSSSSFVKSELYIFSQEGQR